MALLGLGLVGASGVLVQGIRRANDTITVTGASTERIRSDHADWSVDVSQSSTSQQASYAGLPPAVHTTMTFLRSQGIQPDEVETGAVKADKEDVHDPRSGKLRSTRWTSRQVIRIRSPDLYRIARVASGIGELIGRGVPLTINEPAYTYTQLAGKRVDMLAKAEPRGGRSHDRDKYGPDPGFGGSAGWAFPTKTDWSHHPVARLISAHGNWLTGSERKPQ